MLIAKRNAMSGKKLPYARRLAYLESSSNQYIDTKISPVASRFGFKCKIMPLEYGTTGLIGCRRDTAAGAGSYNIFCINGKFRLDVTGNHGNEYAYDTGLWYDFDFSPSRLLVNNHYFGNTSKVDIEQHFYLFGFLNRSALWTKATNQRMSECVIYDGDIEVRNYIPVMSYEGNPEMFDTISQTFAERHGDFLFGELDGGGV